MNRLDDEGHEHRNVSLGDKWLTGSPAFNHYRTRVIDAHLIEYRPWIQAVWWSLPEELRARFARFTMADYALTGYGADYSSRTVDVKMTGERCRY